MNLWIRYWHVALSWTAALALALVVRDLALHLTGDFVTGVAGFKLVLMRVPRTFGFLLPFTGLAAAMLLAASPGWRPRWRDAGAIAAIVVSTGLLGFVLLAYVAPWTQGLALSSLLADGAVPAVATRAGQLAQYREAAARAGVSPELSVDANTLGFMYHLPSAASWLAVILAALGLLVGHWTRAVPGRISTTAQRWAIGLFVLLSVALAYRWGWELATGGGVAPALAAHGILIVPAIAALTLAWVTWAARGSSAPDGLAGAVDSR